MRKFSVRSDTTTASVPMAARSLMLSFDQNFRNALVLLSSVEFVALRFDGDFDLLLPEILDELSTLLSNCCIGTN